MADYVLSQGEIPKQRGYNGTSDALFSPTRDRRDGSGNDPSGHGSGSFQFAVGTFS